jgi:putative transposase
MKTPDSETSAKSIMRNHPVELSPADRQKLTLNFFEPQPGLKKYAICATSDVAQGKRILYNNKMKRFNIAPDEFLHVYNRGIAKNIIFFNDRDRKRFLFLMMILQIPETMKNLNRMFKDFILDPETYIKNFDSNLLKNRQIKLINFCLMPNHFHLLLQEAEEGGISKYMQRLQNAYTKYINTKYERSGHLLQGAYKAVLIENNEQLLYISSYIHKNPREIKELKNKELKYFWSSYQDCVLVNRWGKFLQPDIITSQFSSKNSDTYKIFVETSPAKESKIF